MSVSYFIPDLAPEDLHRCEEIVRRSRFIVSLAHTPTPEAAKSFIERIKQEFPDATHNCWAYAAGAPGQTSKVGYSDDGEPHGTAGRPMLTMLLHGGVGELSAVVTRYFGGILLGAGGLVRAYSHTCALALNAAKVCEMHPTVRYMAEVAYPLWDRVQHQLKSLPVRLENPEFTAAVAFELVMKETDEAKVREELTRVTDGRMEWLKTEETYSPWEEENSDGLV